LFSASNYTSKGSGAVGFALPTPADRSNAAETFHVADVAAVERRR